MRLLKGSEPAKKVKQIASVVSDTLAQKGIVPHLTVIQVGDDPASNLYIRNKSNACVAAHADSDTITLPADVTQEELVATIKKFNKDKLVNGILVQLPLPAHINENAVVDAIDPRKDVDCFNTFNIGRLMQGRTCMEPCTPSGIMQLLKFYDIDVAGKHCVIVGRSKIVGRPLATMMTKADATVTLCHSKTENLKEICRQADILVCAIGKPKFFDGEYVKDGAVVIDVGINYTEDGKLCGDVDFESVKDIVDAITPVPGGIGPMTTAMLASNVVIAAFLQSD